MVPARLKNESYAVGLDIGANDIRLVVVSDRHSERPRVENVIVEPYAEGALADAVHAAWKQVEAPARGVICGLGTADVIVHQVEFPEMEPEELRSAARIEAEQLMPNSGEMVIDFQEVARETNDKGAVIVRMLLVAATKADVRDRRRLLQDAKVPVSGIVPDGIGLANALSALYSAGSGGVVGVDLEQGGTNLVVMRLDDRDTLPVVRHIACGVEDMPVDKGDEETTDAFGTRRQSGERWLREVERSVSFASEKMGGAASHIAVVGEFADVEHIASWIQTNLQLSVEPWNPMEHLARGDGAPDEKTIDRLGARCALAVGLALMEES